MLDKSIRILYYSLFFVTPLLMFPFTSELFEFNKMMFIYLTSVLVGFLWILKSNQEKNLVLKKTPLGIPILIFLLSLIFSTLFSIDKLTSLFGYYGRFNGGLLSIIAYIVLFYGFVNFSHLINKEKILKMSLLSSFMTIIWALPGRFGYDLTCLVFTGEFSNSCWTDQFRPSERLFSTLGQPNWFGAYLTINFFIGLYFFLRGNFRYSLSERSASRSSRQAPTVVPALVYGGYLSINFLGVIFSRSRSALLALLVGLVFFGAYYAKVNYKNKDFSDFIKKKILPLGTIFLVIVLVFKTGIGKIDKFIKFERPSQKELQRIKQEQTTQVSSEVSESFDIRKIVWKGAIDLGFKYPLFGTGVETFAYSYYFARPPEHNLTSEWDYLYNKAHNEYLNYFATTGFVGIIAYLLMVGAVITLFVKKILENKDFIYLALFCSYITILITNFFGFSTTTINLFFYLIPGFLVSSPRKISWKLKDKKNEWFKIGGFLMALYLVLSLIKYYIADIKYAQSQNYSRIGDYQNAYILLDQALRFKKEHVYEDKLSSALANLAFFASYQKEDKLSKNLASLSQSYNNYALKQAPKNVLYWKTKSKNHYLFYQINLDKNQLTEGIAALEIAGDLSPTDPKIPYTKAIFYSLLEDEEKDKTKKFEYQEKALDEINKSVKLKPDFRDGLLLKGRLLKKYGNNEEAYRILNYILEKISPNDEEVKEELIN